MSAAIFKGSEPVAVQDVYLPKTHNRLVTAVIHQLLENLEWDMKSVSAVAVSSGPGSYTGLRVGASAAKGICMGLDIPLMVIPSLMGLAQGVVSWAKSLDALIVPMFDARRMEVYCAVYDPEGRELLPPHARILTDKPITDFLAGRKALLIGDGVKKTEPLYQTEKNILMMPEILPSARYLGKLIYDLWLEKRFASVYDFEPLYLKEVMIRTSQKTF